MDIYRNSGITQFPAEGDMLQLLVRNHEEENRFVLVLRKESLAEDIIVYSAASHTIIFDFQVIDNASMLKVIWREKPNILFGQSTCHYAEIDQGLVITRHHIIQPTDSFPEHFVCLRGILQSSYLVLACVDTIQKKVVVSSFNISDFSSVSTPNILNDYDVSAAYMSSHQNFLANIKLINDASGTLYLQFLLASGTLRVFSITAVDQPSGIVVDKLFDFAYSDIGYHDCIIDSENKSMIVTFSGQKSSEEVNNIYIATQPLFMQGGSISPLTGQSVVVNQTQGSYWRPSVILHDNSYIVAWEGSLLHYISLDYSLEISAPESTIDIAVPGNVLLHPSLYFCCQENTRPDKDMGQGHRLQKLLLSDGV